jgi:hypothetical protein
MKQKRLIQPLQMEKPAVVYIAKLVGENFTLPLHLLFVFLPVVPLLYFFSSSILPSLQQHQSHPSQLPFLHSFIHLSKVFAGVLVLLYSVNLLLGFTSKALGTSILSAITSFAAMVKKATLLLLFPLPLLNLLSLPSHSLSHYHPHTHSHTHSYSHSLQAFTLYLHFNLHTRSKRPSSVLTLFWISFFFASMVKVRGETALTIEQLGNYDVGLHSYYILLFSFPFMACLFLLESFPKFFVIREGLLSTEEEMGTGTENPSRQQRKPCPEEDAGILSRLTFWWMNSLMMLGYEKPLTEDDLWDINEEDKSGVLSDKFQKHWQQELESGKPSLIRAFFRAFGLPFLVGGIFKVSCSVLCSLFSDSIYVPLFPIPLSPVFRSPFSFCFLSSYTLSPFLCSSCKIHCNLFNLNFSRR